MFEDATFESAGKIHTRSRNWMLATFTLNGSILLALIILPLIYPEAMPHRFIDLILTAPPSPASPPPQLVRAAAHAFHGVPQMDARQFTAPRLIPSIITMVDRPEAAPGGPLITMDTGSGIPGGDPFSHAPAPAVASAPRPHGPVRISSGVAAGLILQKVMPVYPPIAKATHTAGAVTLQAIISKTGTIENLRVIGGPAMLQQASVDAVKQWRYRPFLLNGEPVEVETTIAVIYSLGE
jgi:protein TonB